VERTSIAATTRELESHTSRSTLRRPARFNHWMCGFAVGTLMKRESGTWASTM
jgi:hypothetical protein